MKLDQGYAVLRLTQKQAGFSRPLAEVKRQIQQRMFRDLRTESMDAFVADLRKKYTVTVDEANLAKVTVETGMSTSGPGPAGPGVSLGAPGAPAPLPPGTLPSTAPTRAALREAVNSARSLTPLPGEGASPTAPTPAPAPGGPSKAP